MRLSGLPSLIAIFFAFIPEPGQAQSQKPCTLDDNYCVPFIGCIAERNPVIAGRSYGRKEGVVIGRRNDDVACKGTWQRRFWGGKVSFGCEDGLTGRVSYNVLDKPTGTVSGRGRNSDGTKSRFWSGTRIFNFLARDQDVAQGFVQCGQILLRDALAR